MRTPSAMAWRWRSLYKRLRREVYGYVGMPLNAARYGGTAHYCPVCDSHLRVFLPDPWMDAHAPPQLCPVCRSRPRHRLVWRLFERETNLFDGTPRRLLHVAPEAGLYWRLSRLSRLDYVTADLFNPLVRVKMDIRAIQYPDESFDAIYCSHVLEHVVEDRQAMREFYRVLKPDGWALILVPLKSIPQTVEDSTVTDPAERLRLYGQDDHVRLYGADFADRLGEAGFSVRVYTAEELVPVEAFERLGIRPTQLFYCTKPDA